MTLRTRAWLALAMAGWLLGCGGSDQDDQHSQGKGQETVEERIERSRSYLEQYYDTDDVIKIGMAEAAALDAMGADSTSLARMQLARVRIAQRHFDEAVALLGRVVVQHQR